MLTIVPIVEGHGEVGAFPALLHRISKHSDAPKRLKVLPPIRIKAASLLKDKTYFSRYVSLAGAKAVSYGGLVLILLDCEDDCPGLLGPKLLAQAQAVRSDIDYLVVLVFREYESWFLTAARSLRGVSHLPNDLEPPANVDGIRDAKGWLGDRMPVRYDPIQHQLASTEHFDINEAMASPSFARLYHRICSRIRATKPA